MKSPRPSDVRAGFTLLELLLTVGILAVILAILLPAALDFYSDYQFESETRLLVSLLGRARGLAAANYNESDHGLHVAADSFVLFEGDNYAGRVVANDQDFPRVISVTVSGLVDLVFEALSGRTASSTFTLQSSRKTKSIYINAEGAITY